MCYCEGRPDIYRSQTRKAIKEHRCNECRQTIAKGDKYVVAEGLYDGEWYYFKTCLECQKLVDYLLKTQDCYCFFHGELMQSIQDSGLENEDFIIPLIHNADNNLIEMDTTIDEEDDRYDEGQLRRGKPTSLVTNRNWLLRLAH